MIRPLHQYMKDFTALRSPDESTLVNVPRIIQKTQRFNAEPVFTLAHLAHLSGVDYRYMRRIIARSINPYTEIPIPKRGFSTEQRKLHSPEPELLRLQKWILSSILNDVKPSDYAYAYRRGYSAIDAARKHVGAAWILKFDLKNFFSSISEISVIDIFKQIGYSPLLSFELARLCTYARPSIIGHVDSSDFPYPKGAVPGILPQGAPTSGALSNLKLRRFDRSVAQYCFLNNLIFTRYSDDITISAGPEFQREMIYQTINFLRSALKRERLELNEHKTRITPPGARKIVLGLSVEGPDIRLLREYRRQIETHLRGAKKFGIGAHSRYRHFPSPLHFISFIDGHIAYAMSVDAALAKKWHKQWLSMLEKESQCLPELAFICPEEQNLSESKE